MKTVLKSDRTFKKTGYQWSAGDNLQVNIFTDLNGNKRPMHAEVVNLNKNETIRVPSRQLFLLSDDFIRISSYMIEEAACDGVCESLTGDRVEPDGYDSNGFPSILMACGIF